MERNDATYITSFAHVALIKTWYDASSCPRQEAAGVGRTSAATFRDGLGLTINLFLELQGFRLRYNNAL